MVGDYTRPVAEALATPRTPSQLPALLTLMTTMLEHEKASSLWIQGEPRLSAEYRRIQGVEIEAHLTHTVERIALLGAGPLYYGSPDFCTLLEGALPSNDYPGLHPENAEHGVLYLANPIEINNIQTRLLAWRKATSSLAHVCLEGIDRDGDPAYKYGWTSSKGDELLKAVGAASHLLQQRELVERAALPDATKSHSKKVRRRAAKQGPQRAVTVIDIRHSMKQTVSPGSGGRQFHHRWIVKGHWRNQACGPGRKDHRRIYVPPHVKGPVDAPLLQRDKVYKW